MPQPTMEFYDVKSKKKFKTDDYRLVSKGNRNFLVAKSKEGTHECWKVISKAQAEKMK